MNPKSTIQEPKGFEPIDRLALGLMLVLSVVIGLLVWSGDHTVPRVRDFSWQGKQVGMEDTAFILTFSRPMDQATVEANLRIDPPLPGKFSWAGRRMAYTLKEPAPYGTTFKVELKDAKDQFSGKKKPGKAIQPFAGQFSTRDRSFVYLGVTKEEQGQLILYNLTQNQKTVLTPKDLIVIDFKPYPDGDKILFSAADKQIQRERLLEQQLYTVTTGINFASPKVGSSGFQLPGLGGSNSQTSQPMPAGRLSLVLDNKDYNNLKFDLAPDGQTIVVQRANRKNPGDFGLWVVRPNTAPQPLKNEPGGEFIITPDSATVAVTQGQGVAILPLIPQAKPLDFLPKFGMVLNFSNDGSAAAMVKFNTDYTRSLFLVTNQNIQKELLRTNGSVLSCQFDPPGDILYCVLTQLVEGPEYKEQPYVAAIDLKKSKIVPLLLLPNMRDIHSSLSPDGLALLFDQVIPSTAPPSAESLRTDEGQAIETSNLWLLPLSPSALERSASQMQPEQLPLPGFYPRWLP